MKTICYFVLLLLIAPISHAAGSIQLSGPGLTNVFVQEISNLGSETQVVEHRVIDKDGNEIVQKVPGSLKWLDVTLKRGVSKMLDIAAWRKQVEDGQIQAARRNVQITLYNEAMEPVARFDLVNAWPSAVSIEQRPDGGFVEVLRLVHEGMNRVQP